MPKKRTIVPALLFALAVVSAGCGRETARAEATPVGLSPDVARAAKQELNNSIDVLVDQIEMVRANQVEWTNTCLELGDRDEVCGQALTPGWKTILEAEGRKYEIHTDLGADTVRLKESRPGRWRHFRPLGGEGSWGSSGSFICRSRSSVRGYYDRETSS